MCVFCNSLTKVNDMFIEERHQAILDLLNENGSITTAEIQERFAVSYDSAKRDLRILEEKGLLKRTYGGALSIKKVGDCKSAYNLSSKERIRESKSNYNKIAKEALELVEDNDVIYLTNASIGFLIAQNFPEGKNCTIVTNSISIAEELRKNGNVTTILVGGEMSKSGAFYDAFAVEMVKRFRFDKCFITSANISADFGLSVQKTRSVALTTEVIKNSKTVVGLYPTEKVGFNSAISICPAEKLNFLITDWEVSREDVSSFKELGIKTIVVEKSN